jgi:uncharacterized protein
MVDIWEAAREGDVGEVQRLVGQDPGLLDAGGDEWTTPLICASIFGHLGVVRWLLDKGAAINKRDCWRCTALHFACRDGHLAVVSLLLERGADPTMTTDFTLTPLLTASEAGHLEVVRFLLGHPSARTTINHRDICGKTALWWACFKGFGAVARALLENGGDPAIAAHGGTTPMTVAKQQPPYPSISAEGRRECAAALEVRSSVLLLSCSLQRPLSLMIWLRCGVLSWARWVTGGGAGIPAVEGPAGGRPAGERRGSGGGGARGRGGGGAEGAGGLRGK